MEKGNRGGKGEDATAAKGKEFARIDTFPRMPVALTEGKVGGKKRANGTTGVE